MSCEEHTLEPLTQAGARHCSLLLLVMLREGAAPSLSPRGESFARGRARAGCCAFAQHDKEGVVRCVCLSRFGATLREHQRGAGDALAVLRRVHEGVGDFDGYFEPITKFSVVAIEHEAVQQIAVVRHDGER